jgi:hypothetical protein
MLMPPNQMPIRYRRRHAGFALAIVLVVVTLIGVVIALLAKGAAGTGNIEGREGARAQGDGLISTAANLREQLGGYIATSGVKPYQLWAARSGTDAVYKSIYNLYRPEGGILPPKINSRAYAGGCTDQDASNKNNSDTDSDGCMWYITRINFKLGENSVSGTNGSAMTNEIFAYTAPIQSSICSQINSVLFQEALAATFKTCATTAILSKLAPPLDVTYSGTQQWSSVVDATADAKSPQDGTIPNTVYDAPSYCNTSAPPANLPQIAGAGRNEFCVKASTSTTYMYGKILLVQ